MNNNRMTLTLPLDARWLPLVEDTTRGYARLLAFSKTLEDMIALSIVEACEELHRRSGLVPVHTEYSLGLDLQDDAIMIEISYSGRIPLNPHLTADYEVPDLSSNLDDMDLANLDSLWLHLIKKHMDRVFFQVKGGVHVLKMLKYRRNEGEELRLWVLGLSPALKEKLNVEWVERDGRLVGGLLQDPASQKVLRLGATEAFVVRRMDGKRNLYEIYLECVETLGPFTPHLMSSLFEALETSGMLAENEQHRHIGKMRAALSKIINPHFSIPRPDSAIAAIYRVMRPLVSPVGVALCLVIGLSGLIPLMEAHPFHRVTLIGLEETIMAQSGMLIALYLMILFMVAVHELGHGLVCKHYGGRVPRLGIMFYLASVIFFCDTTSSWSFPSKRQRIMVSLGGPLTTFAFLGAGLWAAAYYAGTGSFWEPVWLMFCVVCFIGLVMNLNPFLRMDAYYVLMDWTGIPNLRARSFKYLERRLLGLLGMRSNSDGKDPERKERVILLLYGLVGVLMTVIFFILPIFWYARLLWQESAHRGAIITGIVVAGIALLRLSHSGYKKLRALRYREYKLI